MSVLHCPVGSGSSTKCWASNVLEGAHVSLHPPQLLCDGQSWQVDEKWQMTKLSQKNYLYNKNSRIVCLVDVYGRYVLHQNTLT